jgi:hypothetical protein
VKRAIVALALTMPALMGLAAPAAGAAVTPMAKTATSAPAAPNSVFEGDYGITNEAFGPGSTRRCLDADTTQGGVNGNKVQIWDCNALIQQDWHFYETGPGSEVFYIVSVKYGKCLDQDLNTLGTNGTRVQLWDCNYQKQQLWYLPWFTGGSPNVGFHQFYANAATRFVLDADSSHGLGNGSVAQLWQNLGGQNQFWAVHLWS